MQISVIICTYNPRNDFLGRVISSLRSQTLAHTQWELLIIDNASKEDLAGAWNPTWHPHGRVIREATPGLTNARLRGIRESIGRLLVFVDDDNVLAADYLTCVVRLSAEWPMVGAFGASIKGEFEIPPPEWLTPYLEGLAIREIDQDLWGNMRGWSPAMPSGAGLCIRRGVANDYFEKANTSAVRKMLGRSGVSLGAGEDGDIAECAIDIGLGLGRFKDLQLTHLIPKFRLTTDYIVRLYAGFAASNEILSVLRPKAPSSPVSPLKITISLIYRLIKADRLQRRVLWASYQSAKSTRRKILLNGWASS